MYTFKTNIMLHSCGYIWSSPPIWTFWSVPRLQLAAGNGGIDTHMHQYTNVHLILHVHMALTNISPHLKSVQQKPLEHRNIISISHRKETETPCPALPGTTSIEFLEVHSTLRPVKANKRIMFRQGFQI